jgi:Uma2 family endonuclease
MTAQPRAKMTVDEFLVWAERQPKCHVLVGGEVFAMSPECARHARVKAAVYVALVRAIRGAGLPCEVLPDGMTVRIDVRTAYEPDALVYCGERLPGDAIEVPNPMIVAEVVSPGTKGEDTGGKLAGYFAVPRVEHYLIVDPVLRTIIHHRRAGEVIETRIASEGTLRLDPPGLDLPVGDVFAEP